VRGEKDGLALGVEEDPPASFVHVPMVDVAEQHRVLQGGLTTILDWIRRTTDEELLVEDGALYPALRRMEKRGWLRSDWAISEKGRRARYYELTAAGRGALEKEGARWQRYVRAVEKLGEA
jgi:DNA-binding MarR family transcriptional regulator